MTPKDQALVHWATAQGVHFHGTTIRQTGATGLGIVATRPLTSPSPSPPLNPNPDSDSDNAELEPETEPGTETEVVLMRVPKSLVISANSVDEYAVLDPTFGTVWGAIRAEEGANSRLACMVFLLYVRHNSGPPSRFTGYVSSLPSAASMALPTLWPDLSFLSPTDIGGAVGAKKQVLATEFNTLYCLTAEVPWCKAHWWGGSGGGGADGAMTLAEWTWADAIYRSRVLDLPGIGISLVPVLDMANHEPMAGSNARYDADPDGNPVLVLRAGRGGIREGEEVTISYDVNKSAGEMIYSYGFHEPLSFDHRKHSIFVDLAMTFHDPLGPAKQVLTRQCPERGIELFRMSCQDGRAGRRGDDDDDHQEQQQQQSQQQKAGWRSDNIWLWTVFEEDGLSVRLPGGEAGGGGDGADADADGPVAGLPVLYWRNEPVTVRPGQSYGARLREMVEPGSDVGDLYRLRATYMILDAIQARMGAIEEAGAALEARIRGGGGGGEPAGGGDGRECDRYLELNKFLLQDNHEFLALMADVLERDCTHLSADPMVQTYLNR